MSLKPFAARQGFDATGNRLINLADPALQASGLAFEPLDGINWETLRAHTGIRIVADDAARTALEALPAELIDGDIVVEQLTGTAWRWRASPQDWVPFGRGGITYVGPPGQPADTSDSNADQRRHVRRPHGLRRRGAVSPVRMGRNIAERRRLAVAEPSGVEQGSDGPTRTS